MNLRARLRSARRGLSSELQQAHTAAICEHLLCSNLFNSVTCVAVYLSSDGEVDLNPVIEKLHAGGIKMAAPRIDEAKMSFMWFDPSETLVLNKWGIREPIAETCVPQTAITVALVPLVAFTDNGDRLGRGKGYYDRYFKDSEAFLVGIGHDLQRVESLEQKAWDRRLDAVVTESGWRVYSRRAEAYLVLAAGNSV